MVLLLPRIACKLDLLHMLLSENAGHKESSCVRIATWKLAQLRQSYIKREAVFHQQAR